MKNDKELISLDDFNKQQSPNTQKYGMSAKNKPNGIKCPDCGEELMDTAYGYIPLSYPSQIKIICEKCKFVGSRFY